MNRLEELRDDPAVPRLIRDAAAVVIRAQDAKLRPPRDVLDVLWRYASKVYQQDRFGK